MADPLASLTESGRGTQQPDGVASTRHQQALVFRSVFARLPSGVTVITTADPDSTPHGMTASSVCSLSLDPLLLVACINSNSGTLARMLHNGRFAVNILGERQGEISMHFATPGINRFADVAHHRVDGVPVLDGALAWLTCRVTSKHPGGDHTIVVGEATAMHCDDGEPLVWHDGRYRALT